MPSPGTRRRKRRGGRPRPSEPRTRGGCIRPRAGPGSFICRFTTALVKRHNGSISFGVPVTGGNRPPDSAWHAGSHTVFGLPPAAAYSVGAIALEASWILARRLHVQMPESEEAAYCNHGDSRLAQGRFVRKGGSDEATETPRRIGCEGHLRRRDSVDSGQSGWSEVDRHVGQSRGREPRTRKAWGTTEPAAVTQPAGRTLRQGVAHTAVHERRWYRRRRAPGLAAGRR